MSSPPPEPTKAEIDQLRAAAMEKINAQVDAGTLYDPIDERRVRTDDKYMRRFLMHHDNDQKLALDMVMDTLKWRHENKCNTVSKDSLPPEFFEKGAMFIHNRDKDGCKMLLFVVRHHQKGALDMDVLKRFFIYWLERLEREEKGEWITVFFDMCDTGMKNMDMEFIQYMINLFKNYYPWILNYIIVFEMPWLLSAMWKIIKTWLPPKSIEKIKFVDKKSLRDYVTPDQALTHWGGTDNYEYKFEPEVVTSQTIANGDIDGRKVHFAEGAGIPPASPLRAKPIVKRAASASGEVMVEIEPSEELVFSNCNIGATATIVLTNPTNTPLAFKIKTTSPEKYRVRPSVGVLEAGGGGLEVGVSVSEQLAPATLVRDKFLVMVTLTTDADITSQEVSQLFKTVNKEDVFEVRLRVGVSAAETNSNNNNNPKDTATASLTPQLLSKVDQLLHRQSAVEDQLRSAKRLVFLMLLVMVVVLVFLVMATNNMTSSLIMHSAATIQQQQQQYANNNNNDNSDL